MKKNRSQSRPAAGPRVDPYLEGLMGKLLERLVILEKKVDTVVAQTAGRPSAEAEQAARRDRVLYEAICADCSKVCEVPFKPSEDRAVYCKECFTRRKSGHKPGNTATHTAKNYPVLTPVAMPAKIFSQPNAAAQPSPVIHKSKKAKKGHPAKKSKKKK